MRRGDAIGHAARAARSANFARLWAPFFFFCLLATGSASGGGCRRRSAPKPNAPDPSALSLGTVDLIEVTPRDSASVNLDIEPLTERVRAQLLASGFIQKAPAGDAAAGQPPAPETKTATPGQGHPDAALPSVTVAGEIALETAEVGKRGVARVAVRLRFRTRPADTRGALEDELAAAGEQDYAVRPGLDRQALVQELATRTTTDLIAGLLARKRLWRAPAAEVHAALTGDGGVGLREEAIRVVGARELREEVPTVLGLLNDSEETIRDAALGTLLVLKDERAVHELTSSRSLGDKREMRKIVEALAVLGGDEAREYLGFVADAHDDAEIRALAADARRRLEQPRKQQASR
jgi:hypothetical protein